MPARSRTAGNAALVAGLLFTFFLALSLQVNRGRAVGLARGAVLGVLSPVHRLASGVRGGVLAVWHGYFGLVNAAARAEALQAEVESLRRQLRAAEEARRQNRRLRALLGLRESLPAGGVVARVAARDLAHRYESIVLDRGSVDGVRLDAPVLSSDGALLGRVVEVARWSCLVQLLTDPLSGIGGRLQESRATGLLAGRGDELLELRYVDSRTPIRNGEVVETSGEDGIYPPGIPVGYVAAHGVGPSVPGTPRIPLAHAESALFRDIQIRPQVDLLRIEEVLVIPPRPHTES